MTRAEAIAQGQAIVNRLARLRDDPFARTLTITVDEIYVHQLIGLAEGLAMSGQPELMDTLYNTAESLRIEPISKATKPEQP